MGCEPASSEDPCIEQFLNEFGLRAWRRPLSAEEVARYQTLVSDVATEFDNDPWEGVRYATYALLQSPFFVNRTVLGEIDPSLVGKRRLSAYEVAAQLAYSLTASPPDSSLISAAESGLLATDSGVLEQAARLLESEAADAVVEQFCREQFSLSTLPLAQKVPEVIEVLEPELLLEMQEEAISFCVRGLESVDLRSMFQATETELGVELAAFYGVPGPAPGTPTVLAGLPDENRVGILTSAGLMTVFAHDDRTSPTLRGRFVRERLLCQQVLDPPENVITTLPDPPVGQAVTTRERLAAHSEQPGCAGCHAATDPIGFALEHFDAIGRYRTTEVGLTIDATGDLDGVLRRGAGTHGGRPNERKAAHVPGHPMVSVHRRQVGAPF